MLKCRLKRGSYIRVKASGTATDLASETATLIRDVFRNINHQNTEAAYEYRRTLIGVLLDPNSPVWKGE